MHANNAVTGGELCRSQGGGGVLLPPALAEAVGEEQVAIPYPDEGDARTEVPAFLFPKVNFRTLNDSAVCAPSCVHGSVHKYT